MSIPSAGAFAWFPNFWGEQAVAGWQKEARTLEIIEGLAPLPPEVLANRARDIHRDAEEARGTVSRKKLDSNV